LALAGLSNVTFAPALRTARFSDQYRPPAVSSLDTIEERLITISDGGPANAFVYTVIPSVSGTVATAFNKDSSALGSLITHRKLGQGSVYVLGHDLIHLSGRTCYINCFQPTADVLGLMLRDAFRESAQGHVVLKHTVPRLENSMLLLSHDCDTVMCKTRNDTEWGEPVAVQFARLEASKGAKGSFMMTTDVRPKYYTGEYTPQLSKSLCSLGMCPFGAHSVTHKDMKTLPNGTCTETIKSYSLPNSTLTVCGEVKGLTF